MSRGVDSRLSARVEETRAFYRHRPAGRGPRDRGELIAARARGGGRGLPDVEVEVIGGRQRLLLRIHRPASGSPRAVLLQLHGGGFFLGSAAADDVRNRERAEASGIAVVSVDYRLAPEYPWPAAPDDCEAAARWLVANVRRRFGTTQLLIGGFSAGATLAAVTLLRLRAAGINAFSGAVLEFGTYDLSAQTPAGRLIADEYFLETYVGGVPDRTLPDISPIYADPTGLPPMLFVVGAEDVLLDDNLAMSSRLSEAGVDVDFRVYPAAPHGFTAHPTPMADAARNDIRAWLRERILPR